MFWKYLEPLFAPFKKVNTQVVQAKNIKGNIKVDVMRAKQMGQRGQNLMGEAKKQGEAAQAQAGAAQGAVAGAQQAMQQQGQAGAAPAAGGINPNPPIITKGALFWKKKQCTQCGNELDKTWDACPYCAEAAAQAAAAAPKPAMKTQAFVLNPAGQATGMQLLGWIVPLQGPQRGELFTLTPATSIGTDPSCTVVLNDKFMSSKHAEIKAEGGTWILKDLGSTNGTYVNDNRVDKQELVDNDLIKFGNQLVKFKSL